MKTENRFDRAERLLGRAPEPNLWSLGWPVLEERSWIAQWLRKAFRVASPHKCDASVSDA